MIYLQTHAQNISAGVDGAEQSVANGQTQKQGPPSAQTEIGTAQPQPQPNSTSTRVGSVYIMLWTTPPFNDKYFNYDVMLLFTVAIDI